MARRDFRWSAADAYWREGRVRAEALPEVSGNLSRLNQRIAREIMARWECDFCGSEGKLPDGVIVEQEHCPNCGEPVMEVR